jgi:isoamylase
LALSAELKNDGLRFYLVLNAYWESLKFELPKTENDAWRRWIDTSLDSPNDISPWEEAPTVSGDDYLVGDRSVVMLYTRIGT